MNSKKLIYAKLAQRNIPEFKVFLDEKNRKIEFIIRGKLIPENPNSFFNTVMNILQKNVLDKTKNTDYEEVVVELDFEYINSISVKFLVKLLGLLKEIFKSKIRIVWYYENEDEYELGEDIESVLEVPFTFKKIN